MEIPESHDRLIRQLLIRQSFY